MVERWLSPEILKWQTESDSGWPVQDDLRSRSYEILAHAEQVLGQPTSELALVDVITSLRRAIDRRLRALNTLYSFRDIPIRDKPRDLLLLLESLGIIRSHMLQSLLTSEMLLSTRTSLLQTMKRAKSLQNSRGTS